ncbi:MAG: [ribosomal protein S18]-alanine N-acetyltransferase [Methanolobus sp.]|jgi:ribosomal-protein-alanine N-acetyltransferase|nr:[ribosomal protein S18]-alanine N-acetyltransferase [Methanolobus sp.]MDN5309486.1 [ribosomal protein S18]-alanine N-acetyltransferase [Methanolobus sp.]
MKKITIRSAESADIDQIMLLEDESFHENIRESRAAFLERIAHFPEGFLLLEINGEVCGYISSEIWDGPENITGDRFTLGHRISEVHTIAGKELYVSSLGILKKHRGKGYGDLLFTELSGRMSKRYPISSIILLVSENWLAARKIYERNGFRELHRIPGFFNEGNISEGIVMRRDL